LLVIGLLLIPTPGSASADAVIHGLDHVPVAVRDLEQSQADYQALGFVLKPGRPHENGLRNAHVKFADGTEIELITAPAATDALAAEYFERVKDGDGPAFLGLYARDDAALVKRLAELGLILGWNGGIGTFPRSSKLHQLFFAHRQRSASDLAAHFAHANTAVSLADVWLADAAAERDLLAALGAVAKQETACGPFGSTSEVLSLPDGDILFVGRAARLRPDQRVVGATVRVKSLDAARNTFTANRVAFHETSGCARNSVWVAPLLAHGFWLEFREEAMPP
jgi:hypothetical protein